MSEKWQKARLLPCISPAHENCTETPLVKLLPHARHLFHLAVLSSKLISFLFLRDMGVGLYISVTVL